MNELCINTVNLYFPLFVYLCSLFCPSVCVCHYVYVRFFVHSNLYLSSYQRLPFCTFASASLSLTFSVCLSVYLSVSSPIPKGCTWTVTSQDIVTLSLNIPAGGYLWWQGCGLWLQERTTVTYALFYGGWWSGRAVHQVKEERSSFVRVVKYSIRFLSVSVSG